MAAFSRFIGGRLRQGGGSTWELSRLWEWGPGRHSVRAETRGHDGDGNPWRAIEVYYWHPGLQRIRAFGVSPFALTLSEGDLQFEANAAGGTYQLHQTSGPREIHFRWTFDGPDAYREEWSEADAEGVVRPLVAWDHARVDASAAPLPPLAEPPALLKSLEPFEPLLGSAWTSTVERESGATLVIRSNCQWIATTCCVHARVAATIGDGEPAPSLDAYLYRHTGTGALRCLALTADGAVYQGAIEAADGGALQFDLTGYAGDKVERLGARIEFDKDRAPRLRVWSASGDGDQAGRELRFDLPFRRVDG